MIAEEKVLDQNPKDQVGCSERSMDTDVGKDQSGDQQISTEKSGDLDSSTLCFSDLVKLHDADALTYSDLTKPLLLLSPLHSPTVALSPTKLDHEKLDKRTTDVGKVSRRKKRLQAQQIRMRHIVMLLLRNLMLLSRLLKEQNRTTDNRTMLAPRRKDRR